MGMRTPQVPLVAAATALRGPQRRRWWLPYLVERLPQVPVLEDSRNVVVSLLPRLERAVSKGDGVPCRRISGRWRHGRGVIGGLAIAAVLRWLLIAVASPRVCIPPLLLAGLPVGSLLRGPSFYLIFFKLLLIGLGHCLRLRPGLRIAAAAACCSGPLRHGLLFSALCGGIHFFSNTLVAFVLRCLLCACHGDLYSGSQALAIKDLSLMGLLPLLHSQIKVQNAHTVPQFHWNIGSFVLHALCCCCCTFQQVDRDNLLAFIVACQ
jgi:hypothetical protein